MLLHAFVKIRQLLDFTVLKCFALQSYDYTHLFLCYISLKEAWQRYSSQHLYPSSATDFSELQFRSQMSSFLKIPGALLFDVKYR